MPRVPERGIGFSGKLDRISQEKARGNPIEFKACRVAGRKELA
jgi:hypothetical protein